MKYDIELLKNKLAQELIQEYMVESYGESNSELLFCDVFVHNNQVFAFFDYKPKKENPVISEMSNEILDRNLFFGYAKFAKKFNNYNIIDFNVSNYDLDIELEGASVNGVSQEYWQKFYGKILDNNVKKIEFYDDRNILLGTYFVGDNDYYFMELNSADLIINLKFYNDENLFLYDFSF